MNELEVQDMVELSTEVLVRGRGTSEEVLEEAYQVWLMTGRSVKMVCQMLGLDYAKQRFSVHRWIRKQGWEDRRRADMAVIMPGVTPETATNLRIAGQLASNRAVQLMFEAAMEGKDADHKVINGLMMIVDRAGFAPNVISLNPERLEVKTGSGRRGGVAKMDAKERAKLLALVERKVTSRVERSIEEEGDGDGTEDDDGEGRFAGPSAGLSDF